MPRPLLLDSYPKAPGCDWFTGSIKTPLVDTGHEVDFRPERWGRVYLSADTVVEYAKLVGCLTPTESDQLRLENETLVGALAEAEEQVQLLRSAVATLGKVDELKAAIAKLTDDETAVENVIADTEPEYEPFRAQVPDKGGDESGEGSLTDEGLVSADPSSDSATDDIHEFPHHRGAGWYLLSDGDTIRGEEAAAEAQAALDEAE